VPQEGAGARPVEARQRPARSGGEIEGADDRLLEHGKRILRRGGVLRLPNSRPGLEAKLVA